MNALRNKVSLIGRLGRDPETVSFDSGKSITKFSMATHQRLQTKERRLGRTGTVAQRECLGPIGRQDARCT